MKPGTIIDRLASLAPPPPGDGWAALESLFDHVPDTVFFVKDREGRYIAGNQALVERCGARDKAAVIGHPVGDLFPGELGARSGRQDRLVLQTGRPIRNHLELHWHARHRPTWCLTTKLPLRDARGAVVGLIGISRDVPELGEREAVAANLARALEFLDESFGESLKPATLAQRAGMSPVRFARAVKRLFRLTPSQLIAQTRIESAARFLRESDRSVAEIGLACGFYDHSAFTRAFRSATGMTPTQWRNSFVSPPPL